MDKNSPLEDQMKVMQTHFGRIVSTVKHLKSSVDDLLEKYASQNKEVQEVLEAQKVIEEVIVANSDAINHIKRGLRNKGNEENVIEEADTNEVEDVLGNIVEKQQEIDQNISKNTEVVKRLDREIQKIMMDKNKKDTSKKELDDAINRLDKEIKLLKTCDKDTKSADELENKGKYKQKKFKKCKYYNVGYCKYNEKCRFIHPGKTCQNYLEGKCNESDCPSRHPRACKWYQGAKGCRRIEICKYSHDTLICGEQKLVEAETMDKEFKCVSCSHTWKESNCVVKHLINNMEVYFCLNCDDWVKYKSKVFDQGWSLFDGEGNLNQYI